MNDSQPKHMTGALLSGVIYLDGRHGERSTLVCYPGRRDCPGRCPQPVMRRGGLDEATPYSGHAGRADRTVCSGPPSRPPERQKVRRSRLAQLRLPSARPALGFLSKPMKKKRIRSRKAKGLLKIMKKKPNLMNLTRKLSREKSSSGRSIEGQTPVLTIPAAQPERKISGKPDKAPAMASLFDGLDLS